MDGVHTSSQIRHYSALESRSMRLIWDHHELKRSGAVSASMSQCQHRASTEHEARDYSLRSGNNLGMSSVFAGS
jgi:hypothetical protein